MAQLELAEEVAGPPPRLGRKRDHTRDAEILDATLEVLSENGYDAMTIDQVAARARAGKATVYRRWSSKAELVIDAVACMKKTRIDLDNLPDTGTLRGDLVAMIKPPTLQESERRMHIMAGIVSMLSKSPELAHAAQEAIVAPRRAATRVLIQRAIDRGEIPDTPHLDLISGVSSSIVANRVLLERAPVTREFLVSIIDGVLLPALGARAEA
ncbi:TetR/AcrR family transcriptional regulator [Microbacterium sp. RD1]|uniref:TetR/AcrR family transcriptional regulator n=1 Tax=Microbacterium sp. RD1 TaxID=3457313 RepID=UPI003FA56968